MKRTLNLVTVIAIIGYSVAVCYFIGALIGIFSGEGLGIFHLGTVGAALAGAKGAEKLQRNGLIMFEALNKKGKISLCVLFPNDEKGLKSLDHFQDMAKLSNVGFFNWPSQNPDKDKYVSIGLHNRPESLKLVDSFDKMNFKTAKEFAVDVRTAKVAAKDAKKAEKEANKKGGSVVLAKIAAIKDMIASGQITGEAGLTEIMKLA